MSNRQQRRAAMSESRHGKSWDWVEAPFTAAQVPPALRRIKLVVRNDFWIVQFFDFECAWGTMLHLMIRSVQFPRGPGSGLEPSWQDLQRIKNELCGVDAEAVQVYPRQQDVMDQVDMYHLFVMPRAQALPFGLHRECGFERGDEEEGATGERYEHGKGARHGA